MKNLTLYSLTLVATTMAAMPLHAADGNETDRTYRAVVAEDAPATRLAPHSHPDEKLGIRLPRATPQGTVDTTPSSGPSAWSDRTRHFHPRDAK